MHAIMMDFMIWGHLTRPRELFRAQGSALTRDVATLLVSFRRLLDLYFIDEITYADSVIGGIENSFDPQVDCLCFE